jgi:aminotransferase
MIMTGVNIPHMVQIVRYNGIVPVPVEVNALTLGSTLEDVKKAVTPRTKGIMISYVYGAKFDATEIIEWCHQKGLLIIEDQAESFYDVELKGIIKYI